MTGAAAPLGRQAERMASERAAPAARLVRARLQGGFPASNAVPDFGSPAATAAGSVVLGAPLAAMEFHGITAAIAARRGGGATGCGG